MTTKYGLRTRVITLTLAPTLIIGLLLSAFFSYNRYHDLESQVINAGSNIIEPLAIASEEGLEKQSRESVRRIISYAHRKNSQFVRSIAVFDKFHELFVTSNFHPHFESLTYPKNKPIPILGSSEMKDNNTLILRTPILAESRLIDGTANAETLPVLGYIVIELDLSSLRLQQYQEIFSAILVLVLGLALSGVFAFRLLHDVTRPITHMKNMLDRIRRGHLDVRIEGEMHGELDELKKGINAMAVSLSEYHVEMQHSIDQATSDLRETLEQLEIQNVELDIAKKRAQEAARVKSEFLANMSHELRTPLNGVIGFTRQILKTQLTNSQKDYLQTIEKSANNLLNIINDILDFSKLEAGKLALENVPFELQENLEEVVDLLATSAHEKGLEINLKVDPKIPVGLVGDPLRIQQVITNLVGNSIKFTERGNIDISVELRSVRDDVVELQFMVRDTGIGISERQQAQLFQAFSQADASISRRYGGTGLGLVITQKLVSQMGGEISLTSRLHRGSTFWFTIRLHTADIDMGEWYTPKQLTGKEVMLIESHMQSASILQQTLAQSGLRVNYMSVFPDTEYHADYVILNFSPAQKIIAEEAEALVEKAVACSENVLCLTKPLARKKLLQMMLDARPEFSPFREETLHHTAIEKMPLTVMAVDDNPANLKLITALLQERVDTVISCTNGQEAVDIASRQKFDIIFMDIQMPQMDGVTACQEIKRLPINTTTPIIAVTAHAMVGERDRLLNEGMDDYLTKPIEEHVLQQVLVHWNPQAQLPLTENLPLQTLQSTGVQQNTSQQAVVDWNMALKQAANKEDLARDMLRMLVESIPEINQIIEHSLNGESDQETLLHHIHKLHGSCSYSGVPRLRKICATLEQSLRSGTNIESLEPELFELQDEMEKVANAAKDLIA
ncbi:Signal transduction histidine-protein kinase BarA [Vibrio mangrovi]|uniref:histidine kinase n=1 Tax=Vibrio mangrovi TaxID=474394 RepID=A0A1Y6IU45_9VIBR|nr:two-component sensor histidine kinase BarA [Vibrio mangrovi]MDW6002958.1 two-component sensor histidine kinase BarA [Vibrio mangrovi]SMS01199.1 Signal transduction histidine-protein kinase BarA [Vibrio mangrovi]